MHSVKPSRFQMIVPFINSSKNYYSLQPNRKIPPKLLFGEVPYALNYSEDHPSFIKIDQLGKRKLYCYLFATGLAGILVYGIGYQRFIDSYNRDKMRKLADKEIEKR